MIRLTRQMQIMCTSIAAAVSLYVFSRFTVDDAFISWRYGKNLIDFGIWNYNPTTLDLTQAYTNPVFAALSVLPAYFGLDVVLFFKVISVASLLGFVLWIVRVSKGDTILPLLFIALPATVLHVFGGLETFWFVWLIGALLISLHNENAKIASILSAVLILVRPEAWLLLGLTPLYFSVVEQEVSRLGLTDGKSSERRGIVLSWSRALLVAAPLAALMAAYFAFHSIHFGTALPSSFHIKSGATFSATNLVKFSLFVSPIMGFAVFVRKKLTIFMLMFFGAVAIHYAMSDLTMNYAERFTFHLFAPLYIFGIYLGSKVQGEFYVSTAPKGDTIVSAPVRVIFRIGAVMLLGCFAVVSDFMSLRLATYYPRALVSHAELGKTLAGIAKKYQIDAFVLGDAGMAAYHSQLNALDNIGLGSAAIARQGISDSLLETYGIDLVSFHSRPDGIRLNDYHQEHILDWAVARQMSNICDIYNRKDYTLTIYAKVPIPEISELCRLSRSHNNRGNREMFWEAIATPPWRFWRE